MKPGDLVVVQLPGIVETVSRDEPKILFRAGSASGERAFWVNSERVFTAPEWTDKPDDEWRQVCADMILHGNRDREAFELLRTHASSVGLFTYVLALEAFFGCFAARTNGENTVDIFLSVPGAQAFKAFELARQLREAVGKREAIGK